MAPAKYLVDNNAIIDYLGGKLPDAGSIFIDEIIKISLISVSSKIELLGFNTTRKNSELLADFVSEMNLVELTSEVVEVAINIRKNHSIKLPDAIIAATAISQDSILITRNVSDFRTIKNLQIPNPHAII